MKKPPLSKHVLRMAVQQRVRTLLQNRDRSQPVTPGEVEELLEAGRAQLAEDLAQLRHDMHQIEADTREDEGILVRTQLSGRLRQFLYDVYEKGIPPWTPLN